VRKLLIAAKQELVNIELSEVKFNDAIERVEWVGEGQLRMKVTES
jgi:hypothetical protein